MLDCSIGDLRVLRTVVSRGSFTAAAAELGYTQSAISKRIAALETMAGHMLVIRDGVVEARVLGPGHVG
jgi:DNA-binding transcriptional LysR family regulator